MFLFYKFRAFCIDTAKSIGTLRAILKSLIDKLPVAGEENHHRNQHRSIDDSLQNYTGHGGTEFFQLFSHGSITSIKR